MNPDQHRAANSNRRFFLRATGVSLALPLLESLGGRVFAQSSAVGALPGKPVTGKRPMRMVCIGNLLGFYPQAFFPTKTGAGYDLPVSVEALKPHQKDLTLFSGLDHGVKGGHFAMSSFLSGVRTADAKGMPEGNLTVDQRAAEAMGGATRFASLTLGSESGIHGGCLMSWTRSGTRVPPISTPRELFRKLFISDGAADLAASLDRFDLKGSILDAVRGDAKSLELHLGTRDQEKLDEFFTSVRDVEQQIELRRKWAAVPKPDPRIPEPASKPAYRVRRREGYPLSNGRRRTEQCAEASELAPHLRLITTKAGLEAGAPATATGRILTLPPKPSRRGRRRHGPRDAGAT